MEKAYGIVEVKTNNLSSSDIDNIIALYKSMSANAHITTYDDAVSAQYDGNETSITTVDEILKHLFDTYKDNLVVVELQIADMNDQVINGYYFDVFDKDKEIAVTPA